MSRARTFVLVVLMLSYGAVGARQPAVRTSVPLGVPVERLADTLAIPDPDRSRILLDVVRIVFDSPARPGRRRRRRSTPPARSVSRHQCRGPARDGSPAPRSVGLARHDPEATGRRQPADLPQSSPIEARRCSITGSPHSTTRRWRPWGLTARRWTACGCTRAPSQPSAAASGSTQDGSWSRAAPAPSRSGRSWSGPSRCIRRRSSGGSSPATRAPRVLLRRALASRSAAPAVCDRPTSCPTARGSSGCGRCSTCSTGPHRNGGPTMVRSCGRPSTRLSRSRPSPSLRPARWSRRSTGASGPASSAATN